MTVAVLAASPLAMMSELRSSTPNTLGDLHIASLGRFVVAVIAVCFRRTDIDITDDMADRGRSDRLGSGVREGGLGRAWHRLRGPPFEGPLPLKHLLHFGEYFLRP